MFNILQINYYNAIDKVKTFQVKVILQIRDEYCWEEKLTHQNEVNNHPLWHLLSVSHYSLPATNALDLVPNSWDFHMLMQYKKENKKKTFVQLMRWQKLLLGEDSRKSGSSGSDSWPCAVKTLLDQLKMNYFKISEDTVSDFSYIMQTS